MCKQSYEQELQQSDATSFTMDSAMPNEDASTTGSSASMCSDSEDFDEYVELDEQVNVETSTLCESFEAPGNAVTKRNVSFADHVTYIEPRPDIVSYTRVLCEERKSKKMSRMLQREKDAQIQAASMDAQIQAASMDVQIQAASMQRFADAQAQSAYMWQAYWYQQQALQWHTIQADSYQGMTYQAHSINW